MTDSDETRAQEHAWRYFELHASQRMSLFNFFLILSGLVTAGIGGSFIALPAVSATLGLALSGTALIFFKLDQRVSFLLKRAEAALAAAEVQMPDYARLFISEPSATEQAQRGQALWTYGRSFRVVFLLVGVGGLASVALVLISVLLSARV